MVDVLVKAALKAIVLTISSLLSALSVDDNIGLYDEAKEDCDKARQLVNKL